MMAKVCPTALGVNAVSSNKIKQRKATRRWIGEAQRIFVNHTPKTHSRKRFLPQLTSGTQGCLHVAVMDELRAILGRFVSNWPLLS